ncbi:MAG: 2-phospho-L-lactate transferase [Candidatus Hodarchaeales archaeon]|jgi:LPPG:FO 2-phospho-L-lactate transferase
MRPNNIVFLSGGTGTPKLLCGTFSVINEQNVTIIGNTGDDWSFYGLHVSPDIDSILLTLADLIDKNKWWGIREDTFNLVHFLRKNLKEDVWFNLGDFDSGLCLFRTNLLNQGKNLTEATEIIRNRLNIQSRILPMANQVIKTQVRTVERIMHLQEFWVKYKGKLPVSNVFFEGDLRKTTPQVLEAIKEADVIIIGPSNPISSVGPILAIFPIREALQKTSAFRIAISPIIGSKAVSGPTESFLESWGKTVSPVAIAELFQDVLDSIMIHKTDEQFIEDIKKTGVSPTLEDIFIRNNDDGTRLVTKIMDLI